jgi:hypothetical protein
MLGMLRIPLSMSMLALANIAYAGAISPDPEGAVTMASASTTTPPAATPTAAQVPDASIRRFQFHATDEQLAT